MIIIIITTTASSTSTIIERPHFRLQSTMWASHPTSDVNWCNVCVNASMYNRYMITVIFHRCILSDSDVSGMSAKVRAPRQYTHQDQ